MPFALSIKSKSYLSTFTAFIPAFLLTAEVCEWASLEKMSSTILEISATVMSMYLFA